MVLGRSRRCSSLPCQGSYLAIRDELAQVRLVWYKQNSVARYGMVLVGAPPSHKLFLAAVLLFIGGPQITPQRPMGVVTPRE